MRLDLATGLSLAALMAVPTIVQAQSIDELFRQGNAAQETGDYATAEIIWRQILQRDPNNLSVYNNLGINLALQGKFAESEAIFRLIITLDPEHVSAHTNLGRVLYRDGRLEEAISSFQQALQIDPEEIISIYELGNVMAELGNTDAAEDLYVQAIEIAPYSEGAKYGLALLRIEQGLYDQAIEIFNDLIYSYPNNINHYIGLGLSLTHIGQLEAAKSAYREAIFTAPNRAFTAYNNLGYLYYREGEYQRALDLYRRAILIAPNEATVIANLEELRRAEIADTLSADELAENPSWLPSDEPFFRIRRSVVKIIGSTDAGLRIGTGWVIKRDDDKLWILTNRHVVTQERFSSLINSIEVEFYSQPPNGSLRLRLPAEVVEITPDASSLDLALLTVSNPPIDIQPLAISASRANLLDLLSVVGHPLEVGHNWAIDTGEVSSIEENELIISGVSIDRGNSGSPILNQDEQVVGLIFEANSGVSAGFGIGYSIDAIMPTLQQWEIF